MTNRDNFFALMNGESFERIPHFLKMCDQLQEKLRTERGVENYRDYYDICFREAGPAPSKYPVDYTPYYAGKDIDYIREWGDGHKYGSVEHFTHFVPCMDRFETPEEVWNFPLPDILADYRWEQTAAEVAALKAADRVVLGSVSISVFEPAWYLRGLEELLTDFYLNEEMAEACLERLQRCKKQVAVWLAKAGVDVIILGDDVGTQHGMMMAPQIWRKFLKPRLAEILSAIKQENPNVLCYYHSDGDIRTIIPELIEVGVDILNPIQPECMDPVEIYHTYRDKVAFWGTIGTQTTMPFGSPAEVQKRTVEMLELAKEHGGLVIAPTHLLEPEVSLENIDMFVETVKSFEIV